ncbi:MAG: PaaI family thioesterase [Pseudomonadota bacterium]
MQPKLTPHNSDFDNAVRASFARQRAMETLGARITRVEAGAVDIEFDYREDLTQQHGFIHAGILSTVLDSACGYAAFSLMPPEAAVLTVEFKINLLSPAQGERFRAAGVVKKSGRTITVAEGEMIAISGDQEKCIATMTGTLMTVIDRAGVEG